ncbi:MAG: hypothetical protein Q7W45_09560 [Bacteroidota bacterium]|nr:hypothetical protein [Bacteroidota bacterium]MDP3144074.1 hypothetical protein [Bacteroidota bacterium]
MKFKFFILLNLYFLFIQNTLAQSEIVTTLNFIPKFGNAALILNDSTYPKNNGDSIKIESLKFYISNIEFLNNDKVIWQEKNSFHLVDASSATSMKIKLVIPPNITCNKIRFNLGIDSLVNVSGVLGGDLDPTKGMYWTWQSGYINFKLEGKSKKCKTRNNEFHFHLGGYQTPYSALQSITLNINNPEKISVVIDLQKLMNEIDLSKQNKIMSPSSEAVFLSKKISQLFSIK